MPPTDNPQWPIVLLRKPSALVFGALFWTMINVCAFMDGDLSGPSIWVYILFPMYVLILTMLKYIGESFSTRASEIQDEEDRGETPDEEAQMEERANVSLNLTIIWYTLVLILPQTLFIHGTMPDNINDVLVCDVDSEETRNELFTGRSAFVVFAPLIGYLFIGFVAGLSSGNIVWGDERLEEDARARMMQVQLYMAQAAQRCCGSAGSYARQADDDGESGIVCCTCGCGGLAPKDRQWVCEDCLAHCKKYPRGREYVRVDNLNKRQNDGGSSGPPAPPILIVEDGDAEDDWED